MIKHDWRHWLYLVVAAVALAVAGVWVFCVRDSAVHMPVIIGGGS